MAHIICPYDMAHINKDLEDSLGIPIKEARVSQQFSVFILTDFSILFQLTMNSFGFPNESTADLLVA